MNRRELGGVAALHLAVLSLGAWVAWGGTAWPVVAAAGTVTGLMLHGRYRTAGAWAGICLIAGVILSLSAQRDLDRLAHEWPDRSVEWEERIQARLGAALDELLREGEGVTRDLAHRWEAGELPAGPALPEALRPAPVAALALFGAGGTLLAWDGLHMGPLPEAVRLGSDRYLYSEGPLFGYLYVTHPLGSGSGTAVAAFLMRADLPPTLDPPGTDFTSRFEKATRAGIQVFRADRAEGERDLDLVREGRSLLQVNLAPPSEAEARDRREVAWARAVGVLLLTAWLLLVLGARGAPLAAGLAGIALPFLLLVLPLGRITGGAPLFSPADFLLPGPVGLTLGDLLAVGVGGAVVLGLLPWRRIGRLPRVPATVGAVLLGAGLLRVVGEGASNDFLAGSEAGWVAFQGALTGLIVLPFALALFLGARHSREAASPMGMAVSLAGALALGFAAAALVRRDPTLPFLLALLWVLPLWGLARTVPTGPGWWEGAVRWVSVGVVSVSLVLPYAWAMRVDARMAMAEERVERLGTRPDPFLEFLLLRAGGRAGELAEVRRQPVEILYRAWTDGGLAWEGVPLWLTYWSAEGAAREELRIGVPEPRPAVPAELLSEAQISREVVIRRFDLADAHYVAAAPLPGEEAVTFVVPARRMLVGASPFGPLFSPARVEPDPMALIPLLPGEVPGEIGGVEWVPTPDGWQGEIYLAFPDEVYHAHYYLDLPGPVLQVARATLLLLLSLSVLTLLWGFGRAIGEGGPEGIGVWRSVLGSFRGRVTLALFAFFLIPAILFGTLAYRTLAGAAVRTAEALAERAVEDAAAWYFDVEGAVDILAQRVGSDLLLYDGGELVGGSMRELVELGLYEGWLPPAIHRDMSEGEAMMTTATSALGGWEYVIAYRRVAGGRVLAAPAPLQAGATALRQRDVADLLGFTVAAGGIFSVLLALLAGRALTRPIQTLRVASERVGAGNMGVHLPEDRMDEFGTVFDAFNRMVARLSSTRRALLRSSRQTRAIVEEVATGVIALDSEGRVNVVNPRAEELLGMTLPVDEPLPVGYGPDDPRFALAHWVRAYFRDGIREAGTELSLGERRVRVRARRIARQGPVGGAVLSLEDVTDELRTERILAWGEMAQQVAHEVKNPLTPIKLGIQHILRAWDDDRADFNLILRRNVESILGEIDRLASISTSFSRYAAPGPAESDPLEAVDVDGVAREVLDLYAAAEGPVAFRYRGRGELPQARARSRELKEVLVNLLENARAALPHGGEVAVEAEAVEDGIEVRVGDNGTGIPLEVLPRVFEPHFSTRSSGSGLGLAIVRRLVDSWGGSVDVASSSGRGTTIRILIPTWGEEAGGGDATPHRG